jgi:hypothetical protein
VTQVSSESSVTATSALSHGRSRGTIPVSLVALFVCAALFLFVSMGRAVGVYDEGIVLLGALRVLVGDLIHRDFRANYGPGQFYVLAALFSAISPTVLVERAWDTAIRAGVALLCYLIAARLSSRVFAALAYLASLIWLAGFGFPGYPVFPALLFTLASIYLLLPLYEGRFVAPGILTAGIAAGCGALFRYDLGLAAATAQALVTLAFLVSRPVAVQDRRQTSLKFTALYIGGLAIPIVPVAAAYLLLGALGDFWFDVVGGARYYAATRGLPFPSINITTVPGLYSTAVYLPILIWAAATFCIFSTRRGSGGAEPEVTARRRIGTNWAALQILVLAIVFFLKGCIRVSPIHMAPAILLSLLLLTVIAGPPLAKSRVAVALTRGSLLIAGCITIAPLLYALYRADTNLRWLIRESGLAASYGSCRPPPGLERLACMDFDHDALDAVRYVQSITKPGDPLFVGTGRHDKIYINDITFYFLAKRPTATKWHHFDPGLQTSATVQAKMVAELKAKKPPIIVRDSRFDSAMEPNASSKSSHVLILDQFIDANYRVAKNFGEIAVLTRVAD